LRKQHQAFRRRYFFQGQDIFGAGLKDITWITPQGTEMNDADWGHAFARCLGLFLAGGAIEEYDNHGRLVKDDNMILLLNSHHENIPFTIPAEPRNARWEVLIDTGFEDIKQYADRFYHSGSKYPLQKRSLVLLRQQKREIKSEESDM
jgi:glycogen operon protein